jgi:hypothetical protein
VNPPVLDARPPAIPAEEVRWVRRIRRLVRRASGRPDGRSARVAEAIHADLGWPLRWGHLRLLDGSVCWIHCWNQLPDGALVDATADQFEERWLGDVVVLSPGDPHFTHYRSSPCGHLFRTERAGGGLRLLARRAACGEAFAPLEEELGTAPESCDGWTELGARAIEAHSGWQLPEWLARAAGDRLRQSAAAGQPLPSRELELALGAATRQRRIASHGEWTSPEWRESQPPG